ncbi:hypothetical protein D3C72_1734770 [compost metagenome]
MAASWRIPVRLLTRPKLGKAVPTRPARVIAPEISNLLEEVSFCESHGIPMKAVFARVAALACARIPAKNLLIKTPLFKPAKGTLPNSLSIGTWLLPRPSFE